MKITLAVLAEKLDNLIANNKKEHSDILAQVERTNGSVADHEKRVGKLENWRWMLIGGWGVLTAITIPILFIMLRQWLST